MSHTNQTANYNLPQFIGTDKPAWLVDVNQAFADIDTQMKANETAGATAEANAQSALSGVSALTSQVGTLQTSVTALETARPLDEAQIETNRQNIATNAQNIVDLDNRMGHTSIATIGDGTATGAISDLQSQINNIPAVSDMIGATASDAGTHGLVPAPSAGDEGKYLKGDGTWGNPTPAEPTSATNHALTINVPYTAQHDGYLSVVASVNSIAAANVKVSGTSIASVGATATATSAMTNSIYVRKGMAVTLIAGDGYFFEFD